MKAFLPICVLVVSGCAAANGLDGNSALINVSDEPVSSACEFGGVKIQSGFDTNTNGLLDPDEVDDTEYICNGGASDQTLTRASEEAPGENCESGGVRIEFGGDGDQNGSLGDEEVEDTEYVCNGGDGTDGMNGTNGDDGMNGTNGVDGDDGLSYLTNASNVPVNGQCGAQTGVRIEAGPDTNGNGTLDPGEVADSEVVCDGADGAGGGGASVIASSYLATEVRSSGGAVTILTVTVAAPAAGTVVVFGTADAFCSATGTPTCYTGGGPTAASVRVVDTSSADPSTGTGWGYFFLDADTTENVQRSNTFTVPGPGSYTYYLRGEALVGNVGFWRSQMSAVFVSN